MELMDQWRREWTGTAEYGKVTVGGVTKRVARAMEVLHASAPGARVRVMRAAYHSSAGPGSSSYLMQSSRQVLSSGYNFVNNSSLPSKPLEISSTPLESSPDSEAEKEDYKVTEPDDYDISEPSKWRGSYRKNSIRMPSEESSSADNASIIDLDIRTSSKNMLRRSSQSKENGDLHRDHNINTRSSSLLDAPVALSTLKYASILNSTDDWNRRRKSYSFEETSPLDSISSENNYFAMGSSTDSGICKSSEIVNDFIQNRQNNNSEKTDNIQEETFKEWLSKNRSNSYTRATPPKPREVNVTDTYEDKITLQPSGKITITLPVETYTNENLQPEISKLIDENDRKTKKVEFCKTELHFAVDTGTVNIIATDEKPPPSNDFRRKKSAFIPLNDKIDRPITLFGEKYNTTENLINELSEIDENTAATKSILKNKIPKPKPYLLGENMVIGYPDNDINDLIKNSSSSNKCTKSAVSIINSQLLTARRSSNESTISTCTSDLIPILDKHGTENKGPLSHNVKGQELTSDNYDHVKNTSRNKVPTISPTPNRAKLRELRGTDLAYFGIENKAKPTRISQDNLQEEFNSVKLVQQISNSVCNSEAESDDTPEYQNIVPKHNYLVTPTPKPRSKYGDEVKPLRESKVLKPIIEHDLEKLDTIDIKRSISKRNKDPLKPSRCNSNSVVISKSLSGKTNSIEKNYNDINDVTASKKNVNSPVKKAHTNKENETKKSNVLKPETSVYVNVKLNRDKRSPLPESVRHEKSEKLLRNELKEKKSKNTYKGQMENLEKYDGNKRPGESQNIKENVPHRACKIITSDSKNESTNKRHSHKNTSPSKNTIRSSLEKHKNETKANEITKVKKREDSTHNSKNTSRITKEFNKFTKLDDDENILSPNNNKGLDLAKDIKTNNFNTEKIPGIKSDKLLKSKRSKYVINYDDKNGTVSSICKIKSGPGMYKRKLISVENKDAQKYNTNDKKLNKIALRK